MQVITAKFFSLDPFEPIRNLPGPPSFLLTNLPASCPQTYSQVLSSIKLLMACCCPWQEVQLCCLVFEAHVFQMWYFSNPCPDSPLAVRRYWNTMSFCVPEGFCKGVSLACSRRPLSPGWQTHACKYLPWGPSCSEVPTEFIVFS